MGIRHIPEGVARSRTTRGGKWEQTDQFSVIVGDRNETWRPPWRWRQRTRQYSNSFFQSWDPTAHLSGDMKQT
jgi:hypothetical protein